MPADQYSPHCQKCNTLNADGAKRCALCRRLLPGVAVSSLKARDYAPTAPIAPAPEPSS